jgi:hypothetical protein
MENSFRKVFEVFRQMETILAICSKHASTHAIDDEEKAALDEFLNGPKKETTVVGPSPTV